MSAPAPLRRVDDRTGPAAIGRTGPVLVMFTASWCAACKRSEEEADHLAARLCPWPVLMADIDAAQDLALAARVEGVPSLVLYRDGGLAGVKLGHYSAGQYNDWVQGILAPAALRQAQDERERAA